MKFVLFVEGHTERLALPEFIRRSLDGRLPARVGIDAVRFKGWADYEGGVVAAVRRQLGLSKPHEIIAAIGLIDLYGPAFIPRGKELDESYAHGQAHIEKIVDNDRFRQHFAVHEIEAWLLADPSIHDPSLRASLARHARNPEAVDHETPPSMVLTQAYRQHLKRKYVKVRDGTNLFQKLAPDIVYKCCPRFKGMIDEMVDLAQAVLA